MADKLYHLSKLVQVLEMNPQFTVLQTMYCYVWLCMVIYNMFVKHQQKCIATYMFRHTGLTIMVNKVVHIILIPKEKVFVLWSCKAFPLRSFS